MMGMRMPETCGALFKLQVINLRSCCILLVDSVEDRSHCFHKVQITIKKNIDDTLFRVL